MGNHLSLLNINSAMLPSYVAIESYISIKVETKRICIKASDIICIKSDSNYSTIYYSSNTFKKLLTSRTLKYWADKLNSDLLLKVHNSYLINRNKIVSIDKGNMKLLLQEGMEVPYSRTKVKLIKSIVR